MRIPGIKTAKRFSRWVQARILGGALILAYHRISSARGVLQEISASPENFSEHLHELRKHMYPMSLSKLVQHLRHGSLPEKSIAVTFDDGYADNLYNAKPLLEKYEIPATVFICTGYMGKEFWWDELARLVMSSPEDPSTLPLDIGEYQVVWKQRNVSLEADFDLRRKLCRALYDFLLGLDVEGQNQTMNAIRKWSGGSLDEVSMARSMSPAELLQLAEGGLIEVGAHTRHHPMLPRLSLERQCEEIISGKQDLEDWLSRRIEGFAYPNGKATDDAKRIIREVGFSYACTSEPNLIRHHHHIYEIPRFWPQDWDGEKFMRWLQRWTW